LFHAVAGYRAFDRGTGDDAAAPEARWPQLGDAPYELPHFVPTDLGTLVLACLHEDPEQRPTPTELAELAEPIMAALPKPRLSAFKVSA
jgi:hypothetical protein